MVFDKKQWNVRRDYSPMVYCGCIHNRVDVVPIRKAKWSVFVVVPSDLFTFLLQVRPDDVPVIRERGAALFLDQQEENLWVFGLETLDASLLIDLWAYTSKTFPVWAQKLS